jgi:hypothetical protein
LIRKHRGPNDLWKCKNFIVNSKGMVLIFDKDDLNEWSFPTELVRVGETPIDRTLKNLRYYIGGNALDVTLLFSHGIDEYLEFVFLCKRFNESINTPLKTKWEHFWYLASFNLIPDSKKTLDKYQQIFNL